MTGATLQVREAVLVGAPPAGVASTLVVTPASVDLPSPTTLPAAWLGPAARRLSAAPTDSFAAITGGGRLVLAGASHRGTLYAAYYLLERLGVRFYAPDFPFYKGRHEYVPAVRNATVPSLYALEKPQMTLRRKYVEEGWSHTRGTLPALVDWMAKSRHNVLVYPYDYGGEGFVRWDDQRAGLLPELTKRGLLLESGGHGYQSFLPPERYGEQHPEWFEPGKNVFRVENPQALAAYVSNVIAYLKSRPEVAIFDAWPPDRARWPGQTLRWFGSAANAQAHVSNTLDAALRREGLSTRVESLAFVPAAAPPTGRYSHPPNVLVDFAPYDRSYAEPINGRRYPANVLIRKRIAQWRQGGFRGGFGVQEYYRKYSWHSLPVVLPHIIGADVRHYSSWGVRSLGTYSEPADWLVYEPTHLLVAALSWDPGLDVNRYLDDYLRVRYGPAAPEMRQYLNLVESAGRRLFDRPAGNYADAAVVEDVLSRYRRASLVLRVARGESPPGGGADYLMQRLEWNLEFAAADTEIEYYRLRGDESRARLARLSTRRLVLEHRFDGVVLHNPWTARRFAAPAENRAYYALHRRQWSGPAVAPRCTVLDLPYWLAFPGLPSGC